MPSYDDKQIEEAKLRRSRYLQWLMVDKQLSQIQQFINRYIQSHAQLIIKSHSLTLDQKQQYLDRIKNSGNPK
jgi:CRISPR/Cas system-associated endonuclease Cas1